MLHRNKGQADGQRYLHAMTRVRCEQITKRFGDTVALDAISLDVEPGELFFLLGPSGCGKSTLLRLIAGLLAPTGGRIRFDDRDVTALGTEQRNAVMCFQSYALWPHLTVRENVRFGLDVRGLGRAEQQRRVDDVLGLVQMAAYAARKPNELSGGQQQRVALARALVVTPDCLLLDEPLSNLDARLRLEMRGEIRRICKDTGARRSMSPMNRRRRSASPTGWRSWTAGGSSRSAPRARCTCARRAASWLASSGRPTSSPPAWRIATAPGWSCSRRSAS